MASVTLLHIIGGVCLLLFGLRLVRNGVTRAFGVELRRAISISTKNRVSAFFAGIGVTTLLQSSTATTMIIASFAGQGLIGATAGLAVVLGADVGTTIVAQVLTFDLSWLSSAMLIVGYFFYAGKNQSGPMRQVGRILVGLGLMMLALALIKGAAAPLKESETLPLILKPLSGDPLLAVIFGALLTWLFHSSLAIVLLLMSMVHTDLISVELAIIMVLGANIGNTIAPLLSALKDPPEAARIPCGNLIMRLIAVLVSLCFVSYLPEFLKEHKLTDSRTVVNFHMAFNIALAIIFLPLLDIVAKIVTIAIPKKEARDTISTPQYLDEKVLETPTVALTNAARESLRMADLLDQMFNQTWNAFQKKDVALIERARATDIAIDTLYKAIKNYLVRLSSEAMNTTEAKRHFQVLTFATNIEHVGDILDKSMLAMAEKKTKDGKNFSSQGLIELNNLFRLVLESMRLAQTVFISGDAKLARQLVEDKALIKQAEMQASINHMGRMQQGIPETLATSDLHMDIIRDLRRINSLMAAIAYPILEEAGELKPRLAQAPATTEGITDAKTNS